MSERTIEDYVEIAMAFLKARSTNYLVIPKVLIKECLEQLRDTAKAHKISMDIIEDVSLESRPCGGLPVAWLEQGLDTYCLAELLEYLWACYWEEPLASWPHTS